MARLDRLATVREVVQLGATLGREFSYELVQAVWHLDEEALQKGLSQLVEAELVYQRGLPPQARYIFKHALIQDAAYQSLLKSKRQQYHQQIARVLEQRFPETTETQPELLAHHYTEAGFIAQAIPYWQRAGQRATQRSAYVEAISHLTKGLESLKALPDTPERAQQELTLQIALGVPLIATKGYAAPEVERVYARARELCQQVGETFQLFPVLSGLYAFYVVRAELQTARELAEQFMHLAQSVQDPPLLLEAHLALGINLFYLGKLAPTRAHLEQAVALYNPQQHRSHAFLYGGADSGVACLSYAAWSLWMLGYPDQALKRIHEALTLARELSHPFSLAFALFFAAMLHQYRRKGQLAQERAEAAVALSTEQGFPYLLARGTILRGWVLAEQEEGEKGIAQMRQGLAAWQATGAELGRPAFLALLAEAYGKMGQVEEGLTVLAEALAVVDKGGERFYEAELYRLKGELLLAQEGKNQKPVLSLVEGARGKREKVAEAGECFLKAIEIARRQSAKSLELRAVMSLARLWQQQGKRDEARQMLAEIYSWFTEGFDTADLKEAKELLEQL
jgi:predicted ATPase